MNNWNKGLTLKRHKEIGKELLQMRNRLTDLTSEVGHAYPVAIELYKCAREAVNIIDNLRSRLDMQLFEDHPEIGTGELTRVYYPGDEARR